MIENTNYKPKALKNFGMFVTTLLVHALLCAGSNTTCAQDQTDAPASADTANNSNQKNENDGIIEIRLDPAGANLLVPALKYLLTPPPAELRTGNAAVHYGKADAGTSMFTPGDRWAKYDEALDMSLAELRKMPRDKSPWTLAESGSGPDGHGVFYSLRNAALCRSCDFEIPFRSEDMYRIGVPELSQTLEFATLLSLRVKLQIADGRFEDAIESLQTGFAMGQHVGRDGVSWLFAHNLEGDLQDQLTTWVQTPDAPNLYWALACLPDSYSLVAAEFSNQDVLRRMFPAIAEVHKSDRSEEFWQRELEGIWEECIWQDNIFPAHERKLKEEKLEDVVAKADEIAKVQLVRRGFDEETANTMPKPQRVLLDAYLVYREVEDEKIKWSALPYLQRHEGMDKADALRRKVAAEQVFPLVLCFSSASGHLQHVSRKQHVHLLMAVEMLRAYLATNGGELPEKLSDVAGLPIPMDPVSGKPTVYSRIDKHSATLTPARINGIQDIDVWKISTGKE